jgi:hypothetical protein
MWNDSSSFLSGYVFSKLSFPIHPCSTHYPDYISHIFQLVVCTLNPNELLGWFTKNISASSLSSPNQTQKQHALINWFFVYRVKPLVTIFLLTLFSSLMVLINGSTGKFWVLASLQSNQTSLNLYDSFEIHLYIHFWLFYSPHSHFLFVNIFADRSNIFIW